ncbi:Arm DNA-binding domain-containing protein [Variovorax boronicumulans]|uniref:Arm DNA-binding domain-containing protein n=1 Tax=Variovorax boronicumulans TaxID=436515 RepID=UPI0026A3C2AC
MTLSIAKINSVKPGLKNQKLADSQGLYLFVPGANPKNNANTQPRRMAWRFDYRYAGKRNTLSLGTYC